MKSTTSKRVKTGIGTLAFTIVLTIAVISIGPFGALAQDDSGVVTPTPSGDADDPYDCGDFDSREQVEAVFEAEGDDNSDLDRDGDGIPCESDFPTEDPETDTDTDTETETDTQNDSTVDEETAPDSDTEQDTETEEDTNSEENSETNDEDTETEDEMDTEEDTETEENDEQPPC